MTYLGSFPAMAVIRSPFLQEKCVILVIEMTYICKISGFLHNKFIWAAPSLLRLVIRCIE